MITDGQKVDQTAEEDAQEEAAFEAGFNATDITPVDATDTTGKEEVSKKEEKPVVEEEKKVEIEVKEPEPAKALTIDDLNAALAAQKQDHQREIKKLSDKLFGKAGELQQRIDAIKPQVVSGISPKAKEKLTAEFPELAAMLFDETAELQAAPAHRAVEQPTILPDPRVDDLSRTFERKLLARDHRDWETVVTSPAFAQWRDVALSPEDAAELDSSWDADFISGKISDFKAFQTQAATDAAAAAKKTEEDRIKQERLANGVTQRGIPRDNRPTASDDDEEAAMVAAYGRRK
jgi:hypothetical protein